MTDHNIERPDIALTPEATKMLRRHLLKCAEAGVPIPGESICQAAINERGRINGTPAEITYENRWKEYIENQIDTSLESGELDLDHDASRRQFIQTQTVSFAVMHYLANVIKGAD
jgi:hypothetical protein